MKEIRDIQRPFASWLKKHGFCYVCPRSDVRSTISEGHPDFTVFMPGGKTVFVEVKVPGKNPTPEQVARHTALRAAGYEVRVCHSLEECIAAIEAPRSPVESPRLTTPDLVIYGNGVWERRNGALTAVRAATDADKRTLPRIA